MLSQQDYMLDYVWCVMAPLARHIHVTAELPDLSAYVAWCASAHSTCGATLG